MEPLEPTLRRATLDDADDETARKARASVVTLPRGTQVGRYLLLDLLGEGGMGAVYGAYDPDLDRKVAVKLLKPGKEAPEVARARLLREAQAMARLSHPNVVPVYDTGLFDRQVFVAMELVEGETLHGWLEQPRSAREVLRVFEAAGAGLQAAHGAGLVHRDFKPENVLIGKDGRVRVTDFGLALLEAGAAAPPPVDADLAARSGSGPGPSRVPATEAGAILGTPAYMAPEQYLGEPATARSDQFGFCVALWEALCGAHPYAERTDDFRALSGAVLLGKLRSPARPLPRGLHRVLSRGLSRQPADRFGTMAELIAALRRDPTLRLRRAAAPAALALGLLAAVAPLALQLREESRRCRRQAEAGLEEIWGGERRSRVAAQLSSNAALPAAEILAELDRKLGDWAGLRREACEAARAGREEEGLRFERECLDQYGERAALVVEALSGSAGPDAPVAGLLHQLDPPAHCRGSARRPAAALRPVELVRELERVDLLLDLGRTRESVDRARALLGQARQRGALALASRAQTSLGRGLIVLSGAGDEAFQTLRQAVRDADASGDDHASFDARLELSLALDGSWLEPAEALEVALDAQAWLERLGRPPLLEQLLQRCQASALSTLGRHAEAVALYRKAVEDSERLGLSDADRAGAVNDLGAALSAEGRWAEAEPELAKAVALFEKARWHSMADLFTTYVNLGLARAELGRPAQGLAAMEQGRAIGVRHPELANWTVWSDAHRARVLLDLGRLADAEAAASAVLEKPAELDAVSHARAQACLARVRAALGRPAEALELARKARQADPGTNPLLAADARFALAVASRAAGLPGSEVRAEVEAAQHAYPGPKDGARRKAWDLWLAGDGEPAGR